MGSLNYRRAVEAEIARSHEMRDALLDVAKEGARVARENAPVLSGDYRDSIEGEVELDADGYVGKVRAKDFKSSWIEFGTEHQPPRPVLRNAVEAIGLRVTGGKNG